jgi:hypothetical protein
MYSRLSFLEYMPTESNATLALLSIMTTTFSVVTPIHLPIDLFITSVLYHTLYILFPYLLMGIPKIDRDSAPQKVKW